MTRRERPGVLLVDSNGARSGRIATILAEAGIAVSIASDRETALEAAARRRYDLAIVGAGHTDLAAAIHARQPGLQIFPLADIPLAAGEPRRFVGRVRERLLCAAGGPLADDAGAGEAELFIASAKLACLDSRRRAARAAQAHDLAADLHGEIAETAAHRQGLLWHAAEMAALAAARRDRAHR